jgi:hypothetical protein
MTSPRGHLRIQIQKEKNFGVLCTQLMTESEIFLIEWAPYI